MQTDLVLTVLEQTPVEMRSQIAVGITGPVLILGAGGDALTHDPIPDPTLEAQGEDTIIIIITATAATITIPAQDRDLVVAPTPPTLHGGDIIAGITRALTHAPRCPPGRGTKETDLTLILLMLWVYLV